MKNSYKIIHKIFLLLKAHIGKIFIIVVCLVLSSVINMILPLLTQRMIDGGFLTGNYQTIVLFSATCFFLYLIDSAINLYKEKKRILIYTRFQYDLKKRTFIHLMKMRLKYFKKSNYAEIIQCIENDANNIAGIVSEDVLCIFSEIAGVIGGLIGLFYINWKLTIFVIAFIPIKFLVTNFLGMKNYATMSLYIKSQQEYSKWFGDTIGGAEELRQFNVVENKKQEFETLQKQIIKNEYKNGMLANINKYSEMILIQLLVSVVYIFSGKELISQNISVGGMFAFITYMIAVASPISAILDLVFRFSILLPSANRFFDFMDIEEESEKIKLFREISDIRFENVSFSYEDSKYILNDVNFNIPKGRKTAIVGKNGEGKSTIINLILQTYSPSKGRIFCGNTDISEYNIESYRNQISIINQDIYLFNDTIKNNICMYSDVNEEKLDKIIQSVNLTSVIKDKTYDYIVGDNGSLLSGGQKQKIALARALIQDKSIIIFDEATSNFDNVTTNMIQEILKNELNNKTVVFITHRPDMIKYMDQILLVESGQVEAVSLADYNKAIDL